MVLNSVASASVKVIFKPVFVNVTPHSIDITPILSTSSIPANNVLVTLRLAFGNTPTQRYGGDAVQASDERGKLKLEIHDSDDDHHRSWITERDTHGDITLYFTAHPRKVDINTPIGPRIDLRTDNGGFLGAGCGMLPLPPEAEKVFGIIAEWDLQDAPSGNSTACSLGDSAIIRVEDKLEALQLSLFAVGATLQRYPAAHESPHFGMFWFEVQPFDMPSFSSYIKSLYEKMSDFFNDPTRTPYRIFLRSSPRAFGGAGYRHSFMLEYFPDMPISTKQVRGILAHEIVHNWPLLEGPPIDVDRSGTIWWNEGIATYYQTLLPFRFDLITKVRFVHELNSLAQEYYTNPAVHMSNSEAAKNAWIDSNAQRLPYHRGMMYFIRLAHLVMQTSSGRSSLNYLVLQILDRKRSEQRHGLEEWLKMVSCDLGEKVARDTYESMASGRTLIVPSPDCLAHLGLRMERRDQEMFELGFSASSLNARKIEGLVAGSRAEAAGIEEGHEIVELTTMVWEVTNEFERRMKMILSKEGNREQTCEFEYWPRGYEKVESWRWNEA